MYIYTVYVFIHDSRVRYRVDCEQNCSYTNLITTTNMMSMIRTYYDSRRLTVLRLKQTDSLGMCSIVYAI